MSKSIELTQSQIKALQSCATMFIFPIKLQGFTMPKRNEFNEITCEHCGHIMYTSYNYICPNCEGSMCYKNFPHRKGDKDIFVQEEFMMHDTNDGHINIYYKECKQNFVNDYSWQPASKMTKEQSRYSFNECIDIRVVRVQEINIKDIPKIQTEMWMFDDWYNQQLKEQNINRTYKDNDYVFLVEFKR